MPLRKEVRFFTRGEFTKNALIPEPLPLEKLSNPVRGHGMEYKLSKHTSLYGFTNAFNNAINDIQERPSDVITIDGGPHTFWWPTQSPDGLFTLLCLTYVNFPFMIDVT